ncbi:hypothetical protein HYT91_00275 [Candidatus Pacearchaeota archaeon]|nr:hypothetical protein [Candidatus Pacearchaeota archaeon]
MNKNLENIADENLLGLTQRQMDYRIDKLRCNMPFGLKSFSIRAYFLKQYFRLIYYDVPEAKK